MPVHPPRLSSGDFDSTNVDESLVRLGRSGVWQRRAKPGESTRWNPLDLCALHPRDDRFQREYLGLKGLSSGGGYRDRRRRFPPFERLRHLYQPRLFEHEKMSAKISRRKSESLLQVAELHRAPLEREGQYSQASPLVDNVLKFRGLVTQAILLGYTLAASSISVTTNLPRSDNPGN